LAATKDEPTFEKQAVGVEVNRASKADREHASHSDTVLVKTIRIVPGKGIQLEESTLPVACDALVSALADRVASRQSRECAT
jgi:hypothetical protein